MFPGPKNPMEQVLMASEVRHLEIQDGRQVESRFHYISKTIQDNHKIPNVLSCFLGQGIQWSKL